MNIQYFKSAWGDIKNSPGWLGKLCLLALLNLIPVFGQIATFGYLYGWAREIAWGTHEPMAQKIFANEDGKFWRRGWFVLVLIFVFALIPQVFSLLGNYWQAIATAGARAGSRVVVNPMFGVLGSVFSFVGFVGALVLSVLAWIGNMRISIYDRLSAGFQFGKIWKMLRHDTTGILKIFGMYLLFGLIFGIVLFILFTILVLIVMFAGVAGLMSAGFTPQSVQYMTDVQAMYLFIQLISSAGIVGFLALLVGCYAAVVSTVFIEMLVVRAMGYWTMQFEVVKWGGQDDPLPFEVSSPTPAQPQQPPVSPAAPIQDPLQAQQAQPQWRNPQYPAQAEQAQPQWQAPQGPTPAQSVQPAQPTQPQWQAPQNTAPVQQAPYQGQALQNQAPIQHAEPQWQASQDPAQSQQSWQPVQEPSQLSQEVAPQEQASQPAVDQVQPKDDAPQG